MKTKEQIIEILNNYAGYIDRSRTEQAVHEDNFNNIAEEILSKFSQHNVSVSVCDNIHCVDGVVSEIYGEKVYCHKCRD